jgi:hypothetical protein
VNILQLKTESHFTFSPDPTVQYGSLESVFKTKNPLLLSFAVGRVMRMSQNLIVKPALSHPIFSLNLRGIKEVFPGFALGDFAVLQGSVLSLASLLCARAQFPIRKTSYARQFSIEKHPYLTLGTAELPNESSTLPYFLEVAA